MFVLGAGVGVKYGQPTWPDLLGDLLLGSGRIPRMSGSREEKKALKTVLERLVPDPLLQGDIAHASYPKAVWRRALDDQLGEKRGRRVPQSEDDDPGVLRTIAKMLVRSLHKDPRRHLSVISFNYDALLDVAVREELLAAGMSEYELRSVGDADEFEQSWVDAGIYIYHLHGYLSDAAPETVLDAASYVPVLRGDHWSWRCMERALTSSGVSSLFIGLSLTDPSLRYMLTRWGMWRTPTNGVYLAPPPKLPDLGTCKDQRAIALMYRSTMDLYSFVLDRLHLVCYFLSSFTEIKPILRRVAGYK